MKNKLILTLVVGLSIAIMNACTTTTETITYSGAIENIMFSNCISCHSGAAPLGALDLSSYAAVRASTDTGNLLARINDAAAPMPPSGLMSANDIAAIQQWAADGFPQ